MIGLSERRTRDKGEGHSNAAAVALYEKAGFAIEGIRRHSMLVEKRERQPDDESRVGRFDWPEGAGLRYYDESGNSISKEEWRELGRRKAEKRKRAKAAS